MTGRKQKRYTSADDEFIQQHRDAGLSWDDIGVKMGRTGAMVMDRARRRNLPCFAGRLKPKAEDGRPAGVQEREWHGKDPLPPCHPLALAVLGMTVDAP